MVVTDSGAATWGGINEIVPCQYDAQNHSLTILIEPVTIIELYQKDRPTVISASGLTLWLAYAYGDPSNYAFRFVGYDYTDHKIAYADFANSTTATVVLCPLVPAYDSTNDVGKSLKVGASGLEWG